MVSLCKVLECTVETCFRILFDTGCTLTVYREYHEHDNDDDDDDDNVIIHGMLIFKPGRKVLFLKVQPVCVKSIPKASSTL